MVIKIYPFLKVNSITGTKNEILELFSEFPLNPAIINILSFQIE